MVYNVLHVQEIEYGIQQLEAVFAQMLCIGMVLNVFYAQMVNIGTVTIVKDVQVVKYGITSICFVNVKLDINGMVITASFLVHQVKYLSVVDVNVLQILT